MRQILTNYTNMLIVGLSAINFVILLSVSLGYASIIHSLCASPYCTIFTHIPTESYIGLGLLSALFVLGIHFSFNLKSEKQEKVPETTLQKNKIIKNKTIIPTGLRTEEKIIFEEIVNNDGSVFQSKLVDATGFSKVKVSRILDKLEVRDLVERRRRGMSNIVVLKNS